MKRSGRIVLALLGGASAGALGGCARGVHPVRISPECVYGNDYFVPGAGYYHAPFHAFFPFRYNSYNPVMRRYYYGGQWGPAPFQSVINVSAPLAAAAAAAEASRTDIVRGGFGGYHRGYGGFHGGFGA